MNQRTAQILITSSERIYNSLIRWSVTGIVGIMLMPFGYLSDNVLIFALGVTAFISAFIAVSLNIMRINGINRNMPDDNPPPASAADYLDFEQSHRPASAMLEDGSVTRVGKYRLTQRQWAALARTLANRNWRWSRRTVAVARVVTSIPAPAVLYFRVSILHVTQRSSENVSPQPAVAPLGSGRTHWPLTIQ